MMKIWRHCSVEMNANFVDIKALSARLYPQSSIEEFYELPGFCKEI